MDPLIRTLQEIRINSSYASLLGAKYDKSRKDDSVPTIRNKTIMTDTYMKKLMAESSAGTVMLPPNCRYLEKYSNGTIVVVEVPPAVRTIATDIGVEAILDRLKASGKLDEYGYDYVEERDRKRPRMFTLAMPYTIFILTINTNYTITSGQIYFRTKELSGIGEYLLKAPFSNISDSGFICYGDKINSSQNSIYGAVVHAQTVWWSSIFNSDYTYNLDAYTKTPGLCDYYTWQYLTQTNPIFIYNAKWNKMSFKLGERLRTTADGQSLVRQSDNPYSILKGAFTKAMPTGDVKKPYKRARKTLPLYYDMAQGVFLTKTVCAHVGDAFEMNGKLCHIENYIGFQGQDTPHIMRIVRDNKLINMRLTKGLMKYVAKQITKYTTSTTIDLHGKTIRKGQILIFKNGLDADVYKKVKTIRKAVDGQMELFIGSEYYLSDRVPDFEHYDKDNVTLYGKKITKDDQYVLLKENSNFVPFYPGALVTFDKADINSYDQLNFKFATVEQSPITNSYNILSTNVQRSRLLNPNDLVEVKDIFRLGRSLLRNSRQSDAKIWKTPYGYIKDPRVSTGNPGFTRIKELIKDDELSVQSFDLDLSFKIGDKVVVSDWENPLNMLSVKTVQGFKSDDENSAISFILQDKHDKLSEHLYIHNSVIDIGTIRKVANSHDNINVGTKITAKAADVPCFPKKDTNFIVAFITDTGIDEPLVLCSNCCTLWFNDMVEKFDIFSPRSIQYSELPHADIDLSKIKFQPGDIVTANGDYGNSTGYLLYAENPQYMSNQMKAHNLAYYSSNNEYLYLDSRLMREMRFHSILSPRIKIPVVAEEILETAPCFPNFHGSFNIVSPHLSDFYFPLKLGRMTDVSDFYK